VSLKFKPHHILIADFCIKYGVSENIISVGLSTGRFPRSITYKPTKQATWIDERFFLKRIKFKIFVINSNHDLYYLLSEYFSDAAIGKVVRESYGGSAQGWSTYFSKRLFCPSELKLDIRVSKTDWRFFKYWWVIERRLRRRGTNITKILDRRM